MLRVGFVLRRGWMNSIKDRLLPIISILIAIWVIEIVNLFLGHGLTSWGILPRSASGLIGVPLAPFIHGSVWHAVSNTIPLAILGGLVLAGGKARFWSVTIGVIVISGILVWVFARGAYHVGASGLVFGYFGALLAAAYFERSIMAVGIAVITVALYGGLIWGVLPTRSYISFEGHLFGLVAGVAITWLSARRDVRTS